MGASYVSGVDELDGLEAYTVRALPIVIVSPDDLGRRSPPAIAYLRAPLPVAERQVRLGVPVVCAPRAVLDAARVPCDVVESVVVLDAATHHGIVDLAGLREYVEQHSGWTGVPRVRRALDLADCATRSPWESRLRFFAMLSAGLPRPLVNVPVFSPSGGLLGIVDLLIEEAGLVIESDGQQHRGRRQHRDDNVREERLEATGLIVVRIDSLDLTRHSAHLVRRLVDAHHRGRNRDRTRDTWTLAEPPWWPEPVVNAVPLSDVLKAELYGE